MLSMNNENIISIMETWTALKPEFGQANQLSRDQIRTKSLESNCALYSTDLIDFLKKGSDYPRCADCEWFRSQPNESESPCMVLGAMPLDICCPGFPADCLETLEEIAMEGKEEFLTAGGSHYRYIACLNDAPAAISALADLAQTHMSGWPIARASVDSQELQLQQTRAIEFGAQK